MNDKRVTRRDFLKGAATAACASVLPTSLVKTSSVGFPYIRNNSRTRKALVLGMDGLDPDLLNRFMAEGILPTFKKFSESAHFGKLRTTNPPQSPVAWASFISGTNPGGHGIFDFIHRDPKTFTPHLSISRSFEGKKTLSVGKWKIPIDSGRVELMRHGPTFWNYLEAQGIPASVFQIPSNYPVPPTDVRSVSGMGTPDMLGGYGTSSYYTDRDIPGSEDFDGTRVKKVRMIDHTVKSQLLGPRNSLREGSPEVPIDFTVTRDPSEPVIKISIKEHTIVLRQGEWSEWVPLTFELFPVFAAMGGMVRFYAKEIHPKFQLYVTPINIDPMDPAFPICSPSGYSREIAQAVGRFYTQGLPADTKGYSLGLLSDEDYFAQAKLVLEESMRTLEWQLEQTKEGMMYFYFSSIDQNCHMLMSAMDPTHPLYNPNASPVIKNAIRELYRRMDDALRMTLEKVDSSTLLMVLSDHGFGTFRREFHLNTWLAQNGYLALKKPLGDDPGDYFSLVDWSRTRAYGLGFNGLYLNRLGREPKGIVQADQAAALKQEIMSKLIGVTDPMTGQPFISQLFDSEKIYSGPFTALAPDILVGYQRGYRTSDQSVLGKLPNAIVGDRTNKWSSDHCFDPALVPGVLMVNRQLTAQDPALWDMGPSILGEFGVDRPAQMDGRALFTQS